MTAQYMLGEKYFFSPWMLPAGSVIETDAEPGQFFEPLNDEARQAKEKWYSKEVTKRDPQTGQMVTTRPNESKRPLTQEAQLVMAPPVNVISEPKFDKSGDLVSLAESNLSRAQPQERPGPAAVSVSAPAPSGGPTVPAQDTPTPGDTSVDGGVKVVAPATAAPAGLVAKKD